MSATIRTKCTAASLAIMLALSSACATVPEQQNTTEPQAQAEEVEATKPNPVATILLYALGYVLGASVASAVLDD